MIKSNAKKENKIEKINLRVVNSTLVNIYTEIVGARQSPANGCFMTARLGNDYKKK